MIRGLEEARAQHNTQPTPPTLAEAVERLADEWSVRSMSITVHEATDALRTLLAQHPAERVEMQPGRWWRVLGTDDELWCETSDEDEARESMRSGDRLQRNYVAELSEWRNES